MNEALSRILDGIAAVAEKVGLAAEELAPHVVAYTSVRGWARLVGCALALAFSVVVCCLAWRGSMRDDCASWRRLNAPVGRGEYGGGVATMAILLSLLVFATAIFVCAVAPDLIAQALEPTGYLVDSLVRGAVR